MRKSLAALAACSLIPTALAASTAPAAAAVACSKPTIVTTSISPKTVVVGISEIKGITATAKVRSNGCRVDRVEMGLFGPNFVDAYDLDKSGTSNGVTTYEKGLRITPGTLPNAEAGTWTSWFTVWGQKTAETAGPRIKIIRAARLTTNATPEPVSKGKTITVKGSLKRADWDTLTYRGYGNRKVELQWRTPNGGYTVVKTVTSAANGSVKASVKATKDGCFRFVFKGSTTTAPVVSTGDCVDVR